MNPIEYLVNHSIPKVEAKVEHEYKRRKFISTKQRDDFMRRADNEIGSTYRLLEKEIESQETSRMMRHDIPVELQARRLLVWYYSVPNH